MSASEITVCDVCRGPIWGIEIRGVYDGVLFYGCPNCGKTWPRNWTGYGARQQIADEHARRWSEARGR